MSYIGNQPTQIAFVSDSFSGNASTTAFTMSVAPASTYSYAVGTAGSGGTAGTNGNAGATGGGGYGGGAAGFNGGSGIIVIWY